MSALHRSLLVLVLVVGQWLAAMHAVDHGLRDEATGAHVCQLCLTAHNLGAGLSAALPVLPPAIGVMETPVTVPRGRFAQTPPSARQGAPPFA